MRYPGKADWRSSPRRLIGPAVVGFAVMIMAGAGGPLTVVNTAGAQVTTAAARSGVSSQLGPDQVLGSGQTLTSPNGQVALTMQSDGNLVSSFPVNGGRRVLWASGTEGNPGANCVMQGDGNLVVYSAMGSVLWSSGSAGHAGAVAIVQDDGNTVVYAQSGSPVWSSDTADSFLGPGRGPVLSVGHDLAPGEFLQSPNGQYRLYQTPEGSPALYQQSAEGLWWLMEGSATLAPGPGLPTFFPCALCTGNVLSGSYLTLQGDGNLVLYPPGGGPAEWSAGVAGAGGASLELQDDGNLVLYGAPNADGQSPVVWETGTDAFRGTEIGEGESLQAGQFILSPDGLFKFVMQADGNFVIYAAALSEALWASDTASDSGAFLLMQHDGNLVMYGSSTTGLHRQHTSNVALWESETAANTGSQTVAMTAAATPYVAWLSASGATAEQSAAQAQAAAAAYENAFSATVPPPVIAANRAQLMALIATNILGQNTPAIAATESQYLEMWAQDATTMFSY